MKKKFLQTVLIGFSAFHLFVCTNLKAQDSLTVEQLSPLTYSFNIEDGQLTGPGAAFLAKEFKNAQFTMLGEYHGSKRISEFTEAIIPILDEIGYRTFVLEVGPETARLLEELPNEKTIAAIKEINEKYALVEDDGYVNTSIPFFSNVEDARFLREAKMRNWDLIGIDQEFYNGFIMLTDRMYANLSEGERNTYRSAHQKTIDTLQKYYMEDLLGNEDFAVAVRSSELIHEFLDKMNSHSKNRSLVDAFRSSIHIYGLYADRQWFENNSTRIKYMKKQLRLGLEEKNFDVSKDKLLIKMGGYHLSKGFSPLGLYEVGSTLNEMAEYHGNSCLNIAFDVRFYMENDTIRDVLNSVKEYRLREKDLIRMGKEDQWVVIDLRPMIKGHYYYPQKFKFNEHIQKLVQRYDLLIIPKTEMDPTPNYNIHETNE